MLAKRGSGRDDPKSPNRSTELPRSLRIGFPGHPGETEPSSLLPGPPALTAPADDPTRNRPQVLLYRSFGTVELATENK